MYGDSVVAIVAAPRLVSSSYLSDRHAEEDGDSGHDLGLRIALVVLDAGQVTGVDACGLGESAQAVAAFLALPPDEFSVGLHVINVLNETRRSKATADRIPHRHVDGAR
jgi:hypothetical protein